jgi:hypothetical protein
MQFDVVVGNPPFNPPAKEDIGGSGTRNKIWHRFIEKSFEVLEEDGIVAMVTPTTWRHGNFSEKRQHKKAQELIFNHGIQEWQDAKKHFPMVGHSIGIDWWVCSKKGKVNRSTNPHMLLPRCNDDAVHLLSVWTGALNTECYLQDVRNNIRKSYHSIAGAPRENFIYPHYNSGAQSRKKLYEWRENKTKGFDNPKVIIHDSSGPEPIYDSKGEYGCGSHSFAYTVSSDDEAKDIQDFFSSKLCDWLVHQVNEKNSLAFPAFMFKRIPKNWRELEETWSSI